MKEKKEVPGLAYDGKCNGVRTTPPKLGNLSLRNDIGTKVTTSHYVFLSLCLIYIMIFTLSSLNIYIMF